MGCEFKIETDYQSLQYLTSLANLNHRQSHWMELMQVFNFEIQYVKGKENSLVDSLSRRPFINAMSLVKDTLFDNIKGFYRDDVLISIFLRVCQENFDFKRKLKNILHMFWVQVFYIMSLEFVFLMWGTIKRTSFTTFTIFLFQVIWGFRKHMR